MAVDSINGVKERGSDRRDSKEMGIRWKGGGVRVELKRQFQIRQLSEETGREWIAIRSVFRSAKVRPS